MQTFSHNKSEYSCKKCIWGKKKSICRFSVFCVYFSGSQFVKTSAKIRLPDDCTVGFIVEERLGISMIHCPLFHSHLENLLLISQRSIPQQVVTGIFTLRHPCRCTSSHCIFFPLQVTLSYGIFENKMNSIEVKGSFSKEDDPSRFVSHFISL